MCMMTLAFLIEYKLQKLVMGPDIGGESQQTFVTS